MYTEEIKEDVQKAEQTVGSEVKAVETEAKNIESEANTIYDDVKDEVNKVVGSVETTFDKLKETKISLLTGTIIFRIVGILGSLVLNFFYNSADDALKAFASNGEFLIIGSILCLIIFLIDKITYKGIDTIELLKNNPTAYNLHLLIYVACYAISAYLTGK